VVKDEALDIETFNPDAEGETEEAAAPAEPTENAG
jgi:hypothetical protein